MIVLKIVMTCISPVSHEVYVHFVHGLHFIIVLITCIKHKSYSKAETIGYFFC